jgi:nitrite reductase/ring-hydroxylating ferredoxin subunit
MATESKIRYFFILTVLILLTVSCKKNINDVIPDTYIDFTINLNDPEFVNLTTLFGSAYINSATNNWGERAAGYNNNGIIVFAGPDEFYAYDRTCPYDYAVNNLSIRINVDFTQAICPQCSTYYELSVGGISSSGPGKYPLKNYRTSFDGRYVRVSNY